ncbi:dolichol kinase [Halocatena marina]|uniref:Dolichol kinase n=1 Tax=Halocatena marina TaxID=2934937 RepID=A0ABD5YKG6_9EURY|nr:dolichol kinase [Halocatena marina]
MQPEVERRLVHASGVSLPLAYVIGLFTWDQVRMCFVLGTLLTLTLEALRLSGLIEWSIFETLTREYERDHLAGYALYMFSSTVVALIFHPSVALPALLMLMIADPVVGLLSSSEPATVKPAYILFSMFGICTLIALPFVDIIPAVCGAIAATAADGAKPIIAGYVIDDNLTIPMVAALAIAGSHHLLVSLPPIG